MAALSVSSTGGSWAGDVTSRRLANEQDAWRELYVLHGPLARRFLFRLGVPHEALDDVCQDVFLQIFEYLRDHRRERSFTTWLYRTCSHEAKKKRSKKRLHSLLSRLTGERRSQPRDSASEATEMKDHVVQDALNQLSNQERLIFVLYELEGQSGREIASVVGCPQTHVWHHLHFARKLFRDHIAKEAS